jgi:hypothetical protein
VGIDERHRKNLWPLPPTFLYSSVAGCGENSVPAVPSLKQSAPQPCGFGLRLFISYGKGFPAPSSRAIKLIAARLPDSFGSEQLSEFGQPAHCQIHIDAILLIENQINTKMA